MSPQLTIRFSDELAREIDALARREGISRNRAVLRLLREATRAPGEDAAEDAVGDSLDWFIGSWTQQDAEELAEAVADFEVIDESLWR